MGRLWMCPKGGVSEVSGMHARSEGREKELSRQAEAAMAWVACCEERWEFVIGTPSRVGALNTCNGTPFSARCTRKA